MAASVWFERSLVYLDPSNLRQGNQRALLHVTCSLEVGEVGRVGRVGLVGASAGHVAARVDFPTYFQCVGGGIVGWW